MFLCFKVIWKKSNIFFWNYAYVLIFIFKWYHSFTIQTVLFAKFQIVLNFLEICHFLNSCLISLNLGNKDRSNTYSALRKLGVRPGYSDSNTFSLPYHVKKNLTRSQSAELIADLLSAMEYNTINIHNFHPAMMDTLSNTDTSVIPRLAEHEVYKFAKLPSLTL